ncbi:MAG: hypothetical protein O3A51_00480 [Verrucomicrobia bacterium]|nr:hypothetical protein [Verrucomicrobiota bacterium]
MNENKITLRSFLIGSLFCGIFASLTVYFMNRRGIAVTSTQIPVLPFVLLFIMVLVINPLSRLLRLFKPFNKAELLIIFIMGLISSGISTFGLSAQLIPISGSLYNSAWNNEQTKWNLHISPYVNESFFLAESGIQAAAQDHLACHQEAQRAQGLLEAALLLRKAETQVSEARLAERTTQASGSALDQSRAATALASAAGLLRDAKAEWQAVVASDNDQDIDHILADYPAHVAALQAEADRARATLAELETKAFAKVNLFRRGLPRDLRAFPGIMPTEKDSFAGYAARLKRLTAGRASLAKLQTAGKRLLEQQDEEAKRLLLAAAEALGEIAQDGELTSQATALNDKMELLQTEIVQFSTEQELLYSRLRRADRADRAEIEKQVTAIGATIASKRADEKRLLGRQEGLLFELDMAKRIQDTIRDIHNLATTEELNIDDRATRLQSIADGYPLFDASLRRFLVGDIPWSHWLPVLARWSVLIGLTYLVLMTFNILIFRQWAYHEKLTYPLAELPEDLVGSKDAVSGWVPAIFKSGPFWIGAAISAGVLGWNFLCGLQLVPGMQALDLRLPWQPYIEKTALEGLLPNIRSEIFFTMIGLSFLIPRKISFSLWFFSVTFFVQLLFLVWMGHGVNEDSFPSEWWFTMNFRTAEGGGALMVFGAVVLFKCRRYLLCCLRPSAVDTLEPDERRELRISSALFLMGSAGVILILWRGLGANPYYCLFYYMIMLLVTVGLIRAVAEGGILGFQAWSSPFHFIRTLFGMNKTWTSPSLFVPLMIYHAILFLDVKTFIAPAMANALKIRSDLKMKRWSFHVSIFACILIALVVALLTELMLSYSRGADEMSNWFYGYFPQLSTFGHISATSVAPPAAAETERLWIIFGAVAMAALLFFRRMVFWLPHPIGMIMLVNPLMNAYWFSILVGWLVKSFVSKYGSKDLYGKVRCFFIGLIFGELLLVAIVTFSTILFDVKVGGIPIDLNKRV